MFLLLEIVDELFAAFGEILKVFFEIFKVLFQIVIALIRGLFGLARGDGWSFKMNSLAPPKPAGAAMPDATRAGNLNALATLRVRAVQGDAQAQNELGLAYQHGHGVKQDYPEAISWFRKSADQGVGEAQDALWHFYYGGVGTPQDYTEAYFWAAVWNKSGVKITSSQEQKEMIRRQLTAEQIAAVEQRVKEWKPNVQAPIPLPPLSATQIKPSFEMQFWLFILAGCACALLYVLVSCHSRAADITVGSFETPLTSPQQRQQLAAMGKTYSGLAKDLGCNTFAWGTISPNGRQFSLKYLPSGATLTDWPRMVLITLYELPGNKTADATFIRKTISGLEGQFMQDGKVLDDQDYFAPNKELMMFLEYQRDKINGTAAFKRANDISASFIQLETQGASVPADDVLKIHKLVNPQAKKPKE